MVDLQYEQKLIRNQYRVTPGIVFYWYNNRDIGTINAKYRMNGINKIVI